LAILRGSAVGSTASVGVSPAESRNSKKTFAAKERKERIDKRQYCFPSLRSLRSFAANHFLEHEAAEATEKKLCDPWPPVQIGAPSPFSEAKRSKRRKRRGPKEMNHGWH
jgi:hypothetical protein